MLTHSPRAFSIWKIAAPVDDRQTTQKSGRSARGRRLRLRICLRKECGRRYLPRPRCWNQRYYGDPECLREVRRGPPAWPPQSHRSRNGRVCVRDKHPCGSPYAFAFGIESRSSFSVSKAMLASLDVRMFGRKELRVFCRHTRPECEQYAASFHSHVLVTVLLGLRSQDGVLGCRFGNIRDRDE
jgi:hypothetical protein